MKIKERVSALLKEMEERNIDAYVIPSGDAHISEYVAPHWKSRAWVSGFTGSAGTVVITKEGSGLWTDGRYFIQAAKQLEGSGIDLFKMGQPGVPTYIEWIEKTLPEGACVGFDGKVLSQSIVKSMEKKFKNKGLKINSDYDLIDLIWTDRPAIPQSEIYNHEIKYAGKTTREKLEIVRDEMSKAKADTFVLASLDDIAWLYNIRANDIPGSPVIISYALITEKDAYLFVDSNKVNKEVEAELNNNGVTIKEYNEIFDLVSSLDESRRIFFDPNKTNRCLYKAIPEKCEKIENRNITTNLKAVKNEIEIENLRKTNIKDSVAVCKFIYWLKNTVGKEEVTEISAENKLEWFRSQQELFMGPSFATIAGYKDHAAMMHYKATEESQYSLKNEGMFLVDSGGHYLDGTTDITRTFVLGDLTEEEKRDFTLVLKGHTALNMAKFLHGATGSNLDILARQPIWEYGIDYKCGTGHGVGFLLNIHEGPQNFSQVPNTVKIQPGMIITNEPGIYKEGKHGIRTENTVLAVNDEKTEFGQFMKFDVISPVPIDLDAVVPEMLTEKERNWLNNYHKNVYETIAPFLTEEEKEWLKHETREI